MELNEADSPIEAITVQNLILRNNDTEVLFVHDKGEPEGKRPGFAMPGGSINSFTVQSTIDQILKFLPVYRIDFSHFKRLLKMELNMDLLVFLTSIREGIEETGFLIQPIRVVLEEASRNNLSSLLPNVAHKVVVVKGDVVAGELQERSTETDYCGWFPLTSLPADTYRSHVERIKKIMPKANIRLAETDEEANCEQ